MSFCNKCGAQLAPGMKFCNVCGNPVAQAGNVAPQPQMQQPQMQQGFQPQMQQGFQNYNQMPMGYGAPKKGNKKIAIISIASAVVVAVAVLMIVLFGGGQGTRTKVVDKFMKGFEKRSTSKIVKTMKGIAKDRYKMLTSNDWERIYDEFEYDCGRNPKVTSWKLEDEERLDAEDMAEVSAKYLSGKKIKEAYDMEYSFVVSGSEEREEYGIEFLVAKIGTKWYILDLDIDL